MTSYNKDKTTSLGTNIPKGSSKDIIKWAESTAVSVPNNFEELSAEEQKLYIHKKEQEARKGREFDKTFSHPRLMSEQQTLPVQLDFWNNSELAGTNALKKAKVLATNGQLLNTFSLGIDGDALTLKVIQTLQQYVYETSELYGKDGAGLSGSNTLLPSAKILKKGYLDIPEGTKYPAITVTPYDFAKEVLGGRRPNARDIKNTLNELDRLKNGQYILQDSRTKKGAIMSLLDVTYLLDGNKTTLYIELKPVFAKVVGQNYVRERKDVARYLRRKVRKAMTLLLYEVLITAYSRGAEEYKRYKEELFSRIAKGASYKKNPKRIVQDFKKSIEIMKKIKLLKEYKENEIGSVCIFELNRNFLKENIDLGTK